MELEKKELEEGEEIETIDQVTCSHHKQLQWDDSALIKAWDSAAEQYQVFYNEFIQMYHNLEEKENQESLQ